MIASSDYNVDERNILRGGSDGEGDCDTLHNKYIAILFTNSTFPVI